MIADRIMRGLLEPKVSSKRRPKSLTASIFALCKRRNWYAIKGFDPIGSEDSHEADNSKMLLSALLGDKFHEEAAQILEQCEDLQVVDREFGVLCEKDDVSIYARVDLKVLTPELGLVNIEVKSMSDEIFKRWKEVGVAGFTNYYTQCQIILGSYPRIPLIFVPVNRTFGIYSEEVVKRDYRFISNLLKYKREFDDSLKSDTPPERSYGYTSPNCKNCDYFRLCWFSKIMNSTLRESGLTKGEIDSINLLFSQRKELQQSYESYIEIDDGLKDLMAFLHDKYAVSRIRSSNLSSLVVRRHGESVDKEYLRSILTPSQIKKAFKSSEGEYVRINYKKAKKII